MTYYAFEYYSAPNTTTGNPNRNTGRLSIAGTLETFRTMRDRDAWVSSGAPTCDMGGSNNRVAITRRDCRALFLGMGFADFNEMIEYIKPDGE